MLVTVLMEKLQFSNVYPSLCFDLDHYLIFFLKNVFLWFWTALEEVKHCSVFENSPTGCKYVHSSLLTLLQVSTNTWQGDSVDRCGPTRVPEGVCWSKYVGLVSLEMELRAFSGATRLSHRIIVFISFFFPDSGQWKCQSCHLETAAHRLLHTSAQPARCHSESGLPLHPGKNSATSHLLRGASKCSTCSS